jgi:class 3 adenylate cyclase/pimeloyl-ACP methyl ester carboxylesterase
MLQRQLPTVASVLPDMRLGTITGVVETPETRYAKSGDVHIAYQVVGDAPRDLVYIPHGGHHVELNWENPPIARFLERLTALARLIAFDKRGTGMSDRVVGMPTLETRMDDVRAVMDAAGSDRAFLFAVGDAGPLCALFAASFPERTLGLVLVNSTPRFVRGPNFPWLPSRGEAEQRIEENLRRIVDPTRRSELFTLANPDVTDDEIQSFTRVFRISVSPGTLVVNQRWNLDVDVSDILPSIRVPTLVLHRPEIPAPDIRSGHYLASHIPGARLVELPGRNFGPPLGDVEPLFFELERFLDHVHATRDRTEIEPERVLTTVLFTDIVDATDKASELGDRAWRELLRDHHDLIRAQLSHFRGKELDTAGDGFFATFDGPARAINCACAIRDRVRSIGLEVRAGVHTGECEVIEHKVTGIAVHIGARVASLAGAGEVLVSRTVTDLVAGSGIDFEDRGEHSLRGVPGEWQLYAVTTHGGAA